MNPQLRALKPYPMVELQRRKAALRAQGRELFDFGTGDPIEPTPSHIRQASIDALPEISQYPSVAGSPALRRAVSDYLQRRFAVSTDPEQHILPSAGSKEAIFHVPLAFLDPADDQDTVIYGSPGYPVYQAGCLYAGGRAHAHTLSAAHGFRLELEHIDPGILKRCRLAWVNYPHNPSGAGVDLDYYQRQLAVCRQYDIILCSDECYADLHLDPQASPHPSLLQCGLDGCLVFHSCSKRSGMTGYRSGFIAGDPTLISAYRQARAAMGVGSPAFIEAAGTAAWSDDDHAGHRRELFSAKYNCLRQGLTEHHIRCWDSYGGLYVWAQVPAGWDSTSYAQHCLEAGIIISPGDFFGPGGEGWFRLAVVPALADCQRAIARWPPSAAGPQH